MKTQKIKISFFCTLMCVVFLFVVVPVDLFAFTNETSQQSVTINGKVTDEEGVPLPGVNIVVAGSTRGVATDLDGSYSITALPSDELIFTYLGMRDQVVSISEKRTLNVTMHEKTDELDEVSVVAFAKQKKESIVSAITTVKPAELKVPSSNLTTAFAGRVAGLISYQSSGEPGKDNASFFIRGITSFGASSKKDPLILIDGVELTTEDLARMNTDDIASFSVMKDATATSLYGARGANGVIAVTTKEGREGRVSVNVRLENSFSGATKKIDTADPVTFMRMHNESVKTRDPLGLALYSEEKIIMTERGMYPDLYPATDWYDYIFKDITTNQRANLSISGGGKVARYYVAANVTNDHGNIKIDKRNNFNSNISLAKYNVRTNVNVNVTPTTELIFRMNASFDDYTGPIGGGEKIYRKVMQANPVLFKPYYEPDEQYSYANHILFGNYGNSSYLNPYAEVMKGYRDYSKSTMYSQFEFKQKLDFITEGLKARAMVNMNRYSEYTVDRAYSPFYYSISSYDKMTDIYTLNRLNPQGGTEWIDWTPNNEDRHINTSFYIETALEYQKMIREKHDLSALLVYTMRNEKKGLVYDLQLSLPLRNIGLAGRLAYNYDMRYFLEFTFGYNGSERFHKSNRWGFFPGVAAGWMISNEAFFKPLADFFPTFKLTGSYGLVGNDQIGNEYDRFYYLSQVYMDYAYNVNWGTQLNYTPQGSIIYINRYANKDIGWETSYKWNIGLEFITKFGLSSKMEIFRERRENILVDRIIPGTMGIIPSVKANLGVGEGKGFDVELNYEKSFTNDFWMTGRGTFTYATSKVLEWEEPDYNATPWLSKIGHPIKQTWGYIAERLFIDDQEVANSPTQFGTYQAGDIKYRDVNGDGVISALDMVPIGHPEDPEINFGFGLSTGYKGFDFSFFFQGVARRSFWLDMGNITPFMTGEDTDGRIGQNVVLQQIADSYWSESNRNPYAFWPRLSNNYMDNNVVTSTWFMQDGSFLRLKSVECGYTFSNKLLKKTPLANLRIYASGTNLAYWSRFKLWDPEMAGKGLGYPIQRVVNVGLNIGF